MPGYIGRDVYNKMIIMQDKDYDDKLAASIWVNYLNLFKDLISITTKRENSVGYLLGDYIMLDSDKYNRILNKMTKLSTQLEDGLCGALKAKYRPVKIPDGEYFTNQLNFIKTQQKHFRDIGLPKDECERKYAKLRDSFLAEFEKTVEACSDANYKEAVKHNCIKTNNRVK